MTQNESRQELKLVLRNSIDLIKINSFLIQNGFNIKYPSRTINSFYFDNDFMDHNLSMEGITPRKKIRIRNYGNSKVFNLIDCNLEKKITLANGKLKITKKWKDLNGSNNYKNIEMSAYKGQILKKTLTPTIGITYFRNYYVNQVGVRCTLDKNIRYNFFKLIHDKIKITNTGNMDKRQIFEIKSKNDANLLLEKIDLNWQRFSKYSSGISRLS